MWRKIKLFVVDVVDGDVVVVVVALVVDGVDVDVDVDVAVFSSPYVINPTTFGNTDSMR